MEGMNQETLNKLKEAYEKSKQKGAQRGQNLYWSPATGENIIRILPAKDPNAFWHKETGIHELNEQRIFCPNATNGSACPICQGVKKLWRSKDPADIADAKAMKARKKFYANIIVRDPKEGNKGPYIWTFGIKVFDKIMGFIFNPDYGDITNPKNGFDFKVIKKEVSGFPNYDDSIPRTKPTPAGTDEEIAQWMAGLHDINGLVDGNVKSYKELADILAGFENGVVEDAGDEPVTPPPPVASAPNVGELPQSVLDELKALGKK